jgi:hypothetical protein
VRPLKKHFNPQYIHLVYRQEDLLSPAAKAFVELF